MVLDICRVLGTIFSITSGQWSPSHLGSLEIDYAHNMEAGPALRSVITDINGVDQ